MLGSKAREPSLRLDSSTAERSGGAERRERSATERSVAEPMSARKRARVCVCVRVRPGTCVNVRERARTCACDHIYLHENGLAKTSNP